MELPVQVLANCSETEQYEGQFCANSQDGNVCTTDEGGPLVVQEDDDHWYLVGLISQPSCQVGESIYTDMTK